MNTNLLPSAIEIGSKLKTIDLYLLAKEKIATYLVLSIIVAGLMQKEAQKQIDAFKKKTRVTKPLE